MISFAPIIAGITFAFTFHLPFVYIVRPLFFRISSASFLTTFLSPEIVTSNNIHVGFSRNSLLKNSTKMPHLIPVWTKVGQKSDGPCKKAHVSAGTSRAVRMSERKIFGTKVLTRNSSLVLCSVYFSLKRYSFGNSWMKVSKRPRIVTLYRMAHEIVHVTHFYCYKSIWHLVQN